jgi:hypothetical protein
MGEHKWSKKIIHCPLTGTARTKHTVNIKKKNSQSDG